MNELSITREVDPNKWDDFVYWHPQGSIYHLSLWQQVIERSFKHIHGKYIIARDPATKKILAGLPVYEVKSWLLGNRLVSAPFALVCEPLAVNAAVLKQLIARAVQACEQQQLDYVEIRSAGHLNPDAAKSFAISEKHLIHEVKVTVGAQHLYRSFHKKSIRVMIAKAQSTGLQLRIGKKAKDIERFYEMLDRTRRCKALPSIPFAFFDSLWEILRPKGLVMLMFATYKGRDIGGLLLLEYKTKLMAEYGCDLMEYRKVGVNQFLDWEAIKYAQSKGMETYNLGRTNKANHGLIRYKQRWASHTIPLAVYYYPAKYAASKSMDANSLKYKLAQLIFKHATPGLSRVLGKMLYGHMG